MRITENLVFYSLRFIAKAPTALFHLFARTILFPILFYLFKYRRKVVLNNLQKSFPEKCKEEIFSIEKEFYKYLCDLMLETIKSFGLTFKEFDQRVSFKNLELLDHYFSQNRNVIISLGHLGNYEWIGMYLPLKTDYKVLVPYRKLTNPLSESIFKRNRSKNGTVVFPTLETAQNLKKKYDKPTALYMANDQSAHPYKSFWTQFLHQDTSFYPGTEKLSKIFDLPVIFMHTRRLKRGYYEVEFEVICEQPKEMNEGEILKKHAALLQQDIEKDPIIWLWSHKRWKHAMPSELDYGFIEPHKRKIRK